MFFAIKNAIRAARLENGINGQFHLDAPATAERIRIGCEDRFTKKVKIILDTEAFLAWSDVHLYFSFQCLRRGPTNHGQLMPEAH